MRFNRAQKLHNDNEIIYKHTKEKVKIIDIYEDINKKTKNPQMTIKVITQSSEILTLTHKDVK